MSHVNAPTTRPPRIGGSSRMWLRFLRSGLNGASRGSVFLQGTFTVSLPQASQPGARLSPWPPVSGCRERDRRPGLTVCPRSSGRVEKPAHSGATTREEVVEMADFLARNWVLVLVIGGMAFMHFGMHRGHGKSGHGGGVGGGRANEGHEPQASTRYGSDTGGRTQGSHPAGAVDLSKGSPQDSPAPSDTSVQVEDAPPAKRRRGGCC